MGWMVVQMGGGGATGSGKLAGKTPLEYKKIKLKNKMSIFLQNAQNRNISE